MAYGICGYRQLLSNVLYVLTGGKPLKNEMRRQWIAERKNIPDDIKKENGQVIFEKFISQREYADCDSVFIYVSMKNEVPTTDIINRALKDGKTVAVPVSLKDRKMFFVKIESLDNLVKNSLGVYEPVCGIDKEIIPSEKTLLVVPGVAFDIYGGRMGYGGGYYDTYIEKYKVENRTTLAFDIQIKDRVPRESHDKLMKKIITEKRIITVL